MAKVMGVQGIANTRICTNFLSFGKCNMGSSCPDAHITDPDEEMQVRAKFKQQECNFGASCTRVNCLYRHPGEIMEENTYVPSGMGITLRNNGQGQGLSIEWQ